MDSRPEDDAGFGFSVGNDGFDRGIFHKGLVNLRRPPGRDKDVDVLDDFPVSPDRTGHLRPFDPFLFLKVTEKFFRLGLAERNQEVSG